MMGVARSEPERAIELLLTLPSGTEQQQLTRSLVMSDALSSSQMAALADRSSPQANRSPVLPDVDERVGATQPRGRAELAACQPQPHGTRAPSRKPA